MGQKVNPVGFRIGVNKGWKSVAYIDKADYANRLKEDLAIRNYIEKNLSSAGVVATKTKRFMSKMLVEISVARPGVVIGRGGSGIEKVKKDLARIAKTKIEVKLFEVKDPEASAKLIGESIASQVTRRIVPKFAAQREIEKAKGVKGVKGVRIWVSGRIKGAEIARTEKFQWGSVPLQTLRADIDYAYVRAQVPNAGIHGIKVWIYKGEKQFV
ncbi:30S ribosomal protein S3 [Candidatus Dojkabacteria bacterium]|uniref:Small ribosomal subunit protein uS3 n=1 Tax=Candidatus Dojkabacteria bacterium TaxID=2099670 RepID=A0A955L8W8_9BACT|nr:30S ribosomal protein S3 [Candidatus Dojkabacteria bacterium]